MISISLSLSIAILLSVGIISTTVFAQSTSLDLTSPTITELYGGDKKGTVYLNVQNNTIIATAQINEPPPTEEQVYEGWFEDRGDASGYSLSVGQFNQNNTLSVNQTMVNPYTYTIFYVTTEPRDDFDLKPADILAATKLPIPFGQ
ncbi:MAG TPA: hypothetical protein VEW92_04895 [Nitrososphaeraceae archaeon]|nr:hypothetical protein [Nitrososphaeraceae archaeon]